jgi:uncharacterized protein (DUF885 family)
MHSAGSVLPLIACLLLACPDRPEASTAPDPSSPSDVGSADALTQVDDQEAWDKAMAESRAGVEDEALAELLVRHWTKQLERSPTWATEMGIHRWDDRLSDPSEEARTQGRALRDGFLAEARVIDAKRLTPGDRGHLRAFVEDLSSSQSLDVCDFSSWSVSARGNPLGSLNNLPRRHKVDSETSARNLLSRYEAAVRNFDEGVVNLRRGLDAGRVANAEALSRVVAMFDRALEQPVVDWAAYDPGKLELEGEWVEAFRSELEGLLEKRLRPAITRYRDFVRDELVPKARNDAQAGLVALDIGEACYAGLVAKYTTLELSPKEIHEIGLREMKKINAEMVRLGSPIAKSKKLPKILAYFRTEPSVHFKSAEEVESFARSALADAKAKMPEFFGILPEASCEVTPIPDYEAPFTTIAYYSQPHTDGSKPGEYYINTYAPETRPIYEARVLAYHESIPGHHLQIAIAQELGDLPAFRKHGGQTAFVEGWALYTERLSDEMGLYPEDMDRMGVLSFDAWRAGRLVVDTGIHAMGWSRQQAVDYLQEHTLLAPNNIDNEVDRYITTPGQALAYKIGQLEILELRDRARAKLGDAFSYPDFHDVVLGAGAVSLPVLRERVNAWLEGAS